MASTPGGGSTAVPDTIGELKSPDGPDAAACDADLRQFLDERAQVLNGRWFGEMTPEQARESFAKVTEWNRAKVAAPPQVGSVRDAVVEPGGIPVRVYGPSTDPPGGTLVFLHGGGFVFGSIDSHDEIARVLCELTGLVVVSVEYPLAPDERFPAQVQACLAAVDWAYASAAELGTVGAAVLVGGDSAGGTLAATTAVEAPPATAAGWTDK